MVLGDLERVLAWRNSEHVRQFMYTKHEITLEEHRAWFERKSIDPNWSLLIFEDAGSPCGYVSLRATDTESVAEWGFYTAPSAPKGTGSRLGIAALNYAFDVLGFVKIEGEALASNENSIRFHEKMGFRREDVLSGRHFDGNAHHDILCFGITAAEWQAARARLVK
jgi:UDP-4-amino-4,6-dideoxy-N-acetyl-beta-L-altrosamine N-acetyltransferase